MGSQSGQVTPAVTHVSVGPPSQSLSVQAQGSWPAGGPRWPQCAEGLLLVSEELGHWWQVARALAFSSEAGGDLHLGTCPSQLQALWVAGRGLSLVWVQRTSQHSAWTPWASRAECRARLATCGLQHRSHMGATRQWPGGGTVDGRTQARKYFYVAPACACACVEGQAHYRKRPPSIVTSYPRCSWKCSCPE